jgi:hypothetical protein
MLRCRCFLRKSPHDSLVVRREFAAAACCGMCDICRAPPPRAFARGQQSTCWGRACPSYARSAMKPHTQAVTSSPFHTDSTSVDHSTTRLPHQRAASTERHPQKRGVRASPHQTSSNGGAQEIARGRACVCAHTGYMPGTGARATMARRLAAKPHAAHTHSCLRRDCRAVTYQSKESQHTQPNLP